MGLKRVFLEMSFPINKIFRLQRMVFEVFILSGACCENIAVLKHDYFQWMESELFNIEVYLLLLIMELHAWGSQQLWVPKGWIWDLQGPTSNAFGQGTWRVSTNLDKWGWLFLLFFFFKFLAVLGLWCYMQAFSGCGKLLFVAMHRLVPASHCSDFSYCRALTLGMGSVFITHGLSWSNLYPQHWQMVSEPLDHQGSLPIVFWWCC